MISVTRLMFLAISAGVLLMIGPPANAQPAASQPTSRPATAPAAVPDETLQAIFEPLKRPKDTTLTLAEYIQNDIQAAENVLAMCDETIHAYPDAPNLAAVHGHIGQAIGYLHSMRMLEYLLTSADDLADAHVNPFSNTFRMNFEDKKITLDIDGKPVGKPVDMAAFLKAHVERYKDTPFAAHIYTRAAGTAAGTGLDELAEQYVKVVKEKYMDTPGTGIIGVLRRVENYSDVGKPFKATLTTLDGKKLTLPDDLKGKVVVIDFWATWCGPCVVAMPDLKKFYAAYKDKGVVVIGISLDESKADVEKFLTDKGYDWIQTFDGGTWANPTATRYGVGAIPAVFVVDKEGNLLSDNARGNLEAVVNRALQSSATTKPAAPAARQLIGTPIMFSGDTLLTTPHVWKVPPRGSMSEEEVQKAMEKTVTNGWETDKANPDAPNIAEVHRRMLRASGQLLAMRKDDDARRQFHRVVEHILASNDDAETKLRADFARTGFIVVMNDRELAALLAGEPAGPPDDADKFAATFLEAFVERYNDSPCAAHARTAAAIMAKEAKLDEPFARHVKALKEHHLDATFVRTFLRWNGEHSDVGKPFTATLTTFDGKTLTLPDDLKGNVVVIHVWATWGGDPCVRALPRLKKLYETRKDKGVEVVSISLDRTRFGVSFIDDRRKQDVENFVAQNGLEWIQTFDGGDWEDSTANRYGVGMLPTLLVLDKEGNLYTDSSRLPLDGVLETVVDQALQNQPATTTPVRK